MSGGRWHIEDQIAAYLIFQIEGPNEQSATLALQELCTLYRRGYRLKYDTRVRAETVIVGRLNTKMNETRSRRWCLNALALIGTPDSSRSSILNIIEKFQNDPDTIFSAITAYFRVESNAYTEITNKNITSDETIILAAINGGFINRVDHSATRINVENSSPPILRGALLAIGLDRAPNNIFHPRFDNSELVAKLCKHDDIMVSQYAVWAITENSSLGRKNLPLNTKDMQSLPGNVRGWIYRLFANDENYDTHRHDVIVEGSQDEFEEARRNLALGLRNNFYDGLEEVTCDWYFEEASENVRNLICEHMVTNSERCEAYRNIVLEVFEESGANSPFRKRMLALSSGSSLFAELRRIEIRGEGDLFSAPPNYERPHIVTNKNYNIGNVNSGAFSLEGDASNQGNVNNQSTSINIDAIASDLRSLALDLQNKASGDKEVIEASKAMKAAAENPTPSNISIAKEYLQKLTDGMGRLLTLGINASRLTDLIEKINQIGTI